MSNLVVFDLEMNQGYQPYIFYYDGVEQTLRGEIIQIGAAKVDKDFQVLDTFHLTMKPQFYRKLHHQVARVTGLTQEQLDSGVSVREGLRRFLSWCGNDCTLLAWGKDDVPILKQNLLLQHMSLHFPSDWYDVQQMCAVQFPPAEGEKMKLMAVVERMGLQQEERPFHDALSDVLYTCDVARQLDISLAFRSYVGEEESLRESMSRKGEIHDFTLFQGRADGNAWRQERFLESARCPDCGGSLQRSEFWAKWGSHCYSNLCTCTNCGKESFLLMKASKWDGLHYRFARATQVVDEESREKWLKEQAAAEYRRQLKEEQERLEREAQAETVC